MTYQVVCEQHNMATHLRIMYMGTKKVYTGLFLILFWAPVALEKYNIISNAKQPCGYVRAVYRLQCVKMSQAVVDNYLTYIRFYIHCVHP